MGVEAGAVATPARSYFPHSQPHTTSASVLVALHGDVTGEDGESIRPTVNRLRSQGIGSILDYAAEQDVQTRDDINVRSNAGRVLSLAPPSCLSAAMLRPRSFICG